MCTHCMHDPSFHVAVVEVQCPWKRALETRKSKQFIYIALTHLIMTILPSESQDIDFRFLLWRLSAVFIDSCLHLRCDCICGLRTCILGRQCTPLAVLYLSDVHIYQDSMMSSSSSYRTSEHWWPRLPCCPQCCGY